MSGDYHPWIVTDIRNRDDGWYVLTLRKADTLDLSATVTHHVSVPSLPHPALHVLPERYALCSCCGELAPCSAETEDLTNAAVAERDAADELDQLRTLVGERDRLRAAVARVRALHVLDAGYCMQCDERWIDGCSTTRALDGTDDE